MFEIFVFTRPEWGKLDRIGRDQVCEPRLEFNSDTNRLELVVTHDSTPRRPERIVLKEFPEEELEAAKRALKEVTQLLCHDIEPVLAWSVADNGELRVTWHRDTDAAVGWAPSHD